MYRTLCILLCLFTIAFCHLSCTSTLEKALKLVDSKKGLSPKVKAFLITKHVNHHFHLSSKDADKLKTLLLEKASPKKICADVLDAYLEKKKEALKKLSTECEQGLAEFKKLYPKLEDMKKHKKMLVPILEKFGRVHDNLIEYLEEKLSKGQDVNSICNKMARYMLERDFNRMKHKKQHCVRKTKVERGELLGNKKLLEHHFKKVDKMMKRMGIDKAESEKFKQMFTNPKISAEQFCDYNTELMNKFLKKNKKSKTIKKMKLKLLKLHSSKTKKNKPEQASSHEHKLKHIVKQKKADKPKINNGVAPKGDKPKKVKKPMGKGLKGLANKLKKIVKKGKSKKNMQKKLKKDRPMINNGVAPKGDKPQKIEPSVFLRHHPKKEQKKEQSKKLKGDKPKIDNGVAPKGDKPKKVKKPMGKGLKGLANKLKAIVKKNKAKRNKSKKLKGDKPKIDNGVAPKGDKPKKGQMKKTKKLKKDKPMINNGVAPKGDKPKGKGLKGLANKLKKIVKKGKSKKIMQKKLKKDKPMINNGVAPKGDKPKNMKDIAKKHRLRGSQSNKKDKKGEKKEQKKEEPNHRETVKNKFGSIHDLLQNMLDDCDKHEKLVKHMFETYEQRRVKRRKAEVLQVELAHRMYKRASLNEEKARQEYDLLDKQLKAERKQDEEKREQQIKDLVLQRKILMKIHGLAHS